MKSEVTPSQETLDVAAPTRTDRQKMRSFAKAAQSYSGLGSSKSKAPVAPNQSQTSAPAADLPTPVLPDSGSSAPYNFPERWFYHWIEGFERLLRTASFVHPCAPDRYYCDAAFDGLFNEDFCDV